MHSQQPPQTPKNQENITAKDLAAQQADEKLNLSNWRFFLAMQKADRESPPPGSGRREDEEKAPKR